MQVVFYCGNVSLSIMILGYTEITMFLHYQPTPHECRFRYFKRRKVSMLHKLQKVYSYVILLVQVLQRSLLICCCFVQFFQEGNVTKSTLHLTPTLADHEVYVSCRAKNPASSAVLEDATKLNVHCTCLS